MLAGSDFIPQSNPGIECRPQRNAYQKKPALSNMTGLLVTSATLIVVLRLFALRYRICLKAIESG